MRRPVSQAILDTAFICAIAGAGLLIAALPPEVLPYCAILRLTGRPCPGCGATRALLAILHGDVVAAFHFNPLCTLLGGVLLIDNGFRWAQVFGLESLGWTL